MGIEVRAKDRLFVAAQLPVAIVAAYWYGWRSGASVRLAALEGRRDALVSAEDFDMEKARASRMLSASLAELKAEREAPEPEPKVVASPDMTLAEREEAVLGVFREAGLEVKSGETPEARGASAAGDALVAAAGWRRGGPAAFRRYSLDGAYPCVKKALDAFAARRMGVVVEKVEMRDGGRGRWTLEVWL